MQTIVLCADSSSLAHPELIRLTDVNLEALGWLKCFSSAKDLRDCLKLGVPAKEVWVISSDDMEAVNIVAALHKDRPDLVLLLIAAETNGSLLSRAKSAGASAVLTIRRFAERFSLENTKWTRSANIDCETKTTLNILPSEPLSDDSAFIFTILSGSGGAGKSTVSTIACAIAAERGYKTLLIDCDLQFGDLHRISGATNSCTLDDILAEPEKLDEISNVISEKKFSLIAAPGRLEQADVVEKHLSQVIDAASSLFDLIVVNTGSNWADYHAMLLERSSCSLMLVDQRASSVRACKHALELCGRLGLASSSFIFAVNHCERGALFTSLDVSFVMQGAHVFELKEGGSEVEELLGAGNLSELIGSKNPLCESVEEMLKEILPEKQNKSTRRFRFWKSNEPALKKEAVLEGIGGSGKGNSHDWRALDSRNSHNPRNSRRRGKRA